MTDRDRGAGITKAYLFMRLLPRVLPSIQRAKALRTQIPDMPLQSDRASPSPYRTQLSSFREKFAFCSFSANTTSLMSNCPSAEKKRSEDPNLSRFR